MSVLGAGHICLSCSDIDSQSSIFNQFGYSTLFEDYSWPVALDKFPYMRKNAELHSNVFLKSKSGISIEFIAHHDKLNSEHGPYQVLFGDSENILPNTEKKEIGLVGEAIEGALKCRVKRCFVPQLNTSYYQPATKEKLAHGVEMVALVCNDLKASSSFWEEGLGFKKVVSSQDNSFRWKLLHFLSPIPAWNLKVLLVEDKKKETMRFYLDDSGWTCLSFLVKSTEVSTKYLQEKGGIDLGRRFELAVGGRLMRFCFVRGPDEELVELVEPRMKDNR